jgi:murein DD-endopeptidase MepM/ murein hydrolase activator NlpD
MAKPKYHFNPHTLTYERIDNSFKHQFKRIVVHFFSSISLGLLFFIAFTFIFKSPREKDLIKENRALKTQYALLGKQLDVIQEVLADIELRDNNMYRVIYQADPITEAVRKAPLGGTKRYDDLKSKSNSDIMIDITKKMDIITKELYVQSNSFDELLKLAKDNENRLRCVPAIQPVLNKDLTRTASGYGMRIDPVYGTRKFHEGMDFTAPIGSDVYATGNGTVTFVGWRQGYGNAIIINHGYNYETLYAHLSKASVREGAKVTRGDVIGEVGNTGKSTGPHLHYEVRYRGSAVDPRNYYYMDLSPEEYDAMVQISSNYGRMFD